MSSLSKLYSPKTNHEVEAAGDVKTKEWFKAMSAERQRQYLKLHKDTKHKNRGNRDIAHSDLADFHASQADHHAKEAKKLENNFQAAAHHHKMASDHFNQAYKFINK